MTGIIRGLDPQRRIVVPKETLQAAGLKEKDLVEIYSDNGPDGEPIIVLQKFTPGCVICGDKDDLRKFKGKNLCQECVFGIWDAINHITGDEGS